jgi:F-type H+-transporting ATPase subunit epsilon
MFTLTLVTPQKRLVNHQEIDEVSIPGYRGELGILPGHAPLMTTLSTGVLKYRLKGESRFHFVAVNGGYAQVNPVGVNVLAETAERAEEIDLDRVAATEKEAERRLTHEAMEPNEIVKLQGKLLRARVRREVAEKRGGGL